MSLADDLTKLEDLRRTGALTESEFAKAKAAILAGGSAPASDAVTDNMAAQLAEVRYQNELTRLDREWEIEKEKYMVTGRYGARYLPTVGMGWGTAVVGGGFGLLWTVFAFFLTGSAPDELPFSAVKVIFPLFGIGFTIATVVTGINTANKAEAYNRALEAYERRRAAVRAEDFR